MKGPHITNLANGLVLGQPFALSFDSQVKFTVTSETGLTEFKIHIDSETLTPEELAGVGLSSDLDLINPGDLSATLSNLGFPVGETVNGQTEVPFDITGFVPMLMVLKGSHKFVMTISDANGTVNETLWIESPGQ